MTETFRITVDASEWEEFAVTLEDTSLLEKHMHNAMDATLDALIEMITAETPVNTGLLKGSFTKDIRGQAMDLTGIVATPLIYGWPVEEGRDPGTWPNEAAITLWAKRRYGLSGDKLEMAVWFIRKKIFERGTTGAFMVDQAFKRMQGRMLENIWDAELEAFLKALASG